MSLFSRHAKPENRFDIILGYACAVSVHHTEVVLQLRHSKLSPRFS